MSTPVLPSCYIGSIGLYAVLQKYGNVQVEFYDHYSRQTYRNRCKILSSDGPMDLIIPVEKPKEKTLGKDIVIANHTWQDIHWRSIKSSYDSSPFLEFFEDYLHPFYTKKYKFLYDYNYELCKCIAGLMGINADIDSTSDYLSECDNDYRSIVLKKPKADYFNVVPYYQVFAQKFGFVPNMSAIDLLCNMGPESVFVLEKTLNE